MKKKNNKNLKVHKNSKEQLSHVADKAKAILAVHGVFLMFLLAGGSVGLALYKAQTYLDPLRDENKYQELAASTFNKIDYKLVERLSEALKDTDITVGQDIDPTRKNPFSE